MSPVKWNAVGDAAIGRRDRLGCLGLRVGTLVLGLARRDRGVRDPGAAERDARDHDGAGAPDPS